MSCNTFTRVRTREIWWMRRNYTSNKKEKCDKVMWSVLPTSHATAIENTCYQWILLILLSEEVSYVVKTHMHMCHLNIIQCVQNNFISRVFSMSNVICKRNWIIVTPETIKIWGEGCNWHPDSTPTKGVRKTKNKKKLFLFQPKL